jgi:hypothetical protein
MDIIAAAARDETLGARRLFSIRFARADEKLAGSTKIGANQTAGDGGGGAGRSPDRTASAFSDLVRSFQNAYQSVTNAAFNH